MTIDRTSHGQPVAISSVADQQGRRRAEQDAGAGRERQGFHATIPGSATRRPCCEAARTAANKADAYQANTTLAVNQADLQDTQLSTLSDLANQLRQAMTQAVANNDGSTLMTEAQSIFDQAQPDPQLQGRQRQLYLWRRQGQHRAVQRHLAVAARGAAVAWPAPSPTAR